MPTPAITRLIAGGIGLTLCAALSACSVGDIGGSSGGEGGSDNVSIRVLVPVSGDGSTDMLEALIEGFEKANPTIDVQLETQPAGAEGDNLTKTKLSTGEMAEVFTYNSGSLLQALNPDTTLVNLADEEWASKITDTYRATVSTDNGMYGAPSGTTQAGAILYNKKVYEELGLTVPTTWDEFRANNEKIKDSGKDIAPIIQTFGTDWTAQLFVLGDFANVVAQDPEWAEQYTLNKRKYADQPALQSFLNQEQTAKDDFYNKDAASAQFDQGAAMLAEGKGAHWPMLSSAIGTIKTNFPDAVNDIGIFPIPAKDAATTRMTLWLPNSLYIPKTAEGDKLDAAKKFLAYSVSEEGCQIQSEAGAPSGPYAISTCTLPSDVPEMLTEIQRYSDENLTNPAAEFLSPIKGPSLPNITVEVGRGIRSGEDAAKLYDEDVKKQAQQLGLPGW